jgi:hypothetical protein
MRAKVVIITSTVAASLVVALRYWVQYRKRLRQEKKEKWRSRKKRNLVNIGAVFGMDVGGTLTKIVYFEPIPEVDEVEAVEAQSSVAAKSSGGGLQRPVSLSRSSSSSSLAQLEDPQHKAALKELYSYVDINVNRSALGKSGRMMTRDDNLCRAIPILG